MSDDECYDDCDFDEEDFVVAMSIVQDEEEEGDAGDGDVPEAAVVEEQDDDMAMNLSEFMALPSSANDGGAMMSELKGLDGMSPLPTLSHRDGIVTNDHSHSHVGKVGRTRRRSSGKDKDQRAVMDSLTSQMAEMHLRLQSGGGSKPSPRGVRAKAPVQDDSSSRVRRLEGEVRERDLLLDRLSRNSLVLAQDCDALRVEVVSLRRQLKEHERRRVSEEAMMPQTKKATEANAAAGSSRESALLHAVEELSLQNEELILRLKASMEREIALRRAQEKSMTQAVAQESRLTPQAPETRRSKSFQNGRSVLAPHKHNTAFPRIRS
jgi:hypothetical protein